MNDHFDTIADAMANLTDALRAAGFEAAKDNLTAWRDLGDQDAPDWFDAWTDAVHYAMSVAQYSDRAVRGEGDPKPPHFLSVTPEAGAAITWEWRGESDRDFAGLVLRSVVAALGHEDMTPRSHEALELALPVMRRNVYEYLQGVAVKDDPASISPADRAEVAVDIRAIRVAQSCVGCVPDMGGVDTAWLDTALTYPERQTTAAGRAET
jgi:hypothetical protein